MRETKHEQGRDRERERERERETDRMQSRFQAVSTEPDTGLEPMN